MRKKWTISLIGGVLVLMGLLVLAGQKGCIPFRNIPKSKPEYAPDKILVRFKEDISKDRIEEINNTLKMRVTKVSDMGDYQIYHLKIPEDTTVSEMMEKYQLFPEVEYVKPDYFIHADTEQ